MDKKRKIDNYIADRTTLIGFFKKGNLPTQEHFEQLINSNFNKADDRLDIDELDGLMVYPANQGKLISFFKGKDDENPKYVVSISNKGIFIQEFDEKLNMLTTDESTSNRPEFFIEEGTGNIGIGKNEPKEKLDIDGLIASRGRLGNIEGNVPADGQWHNLFEQDLNGVNAFEIMAYARGEKGKGRYSLMHAIAASTYGKSRPEITKTCSYFGSSANKIAIRWVSRPSRIKKGVVIKEKEGGTAVEKKPLKKSSFLNRIYMWILDIIETKELSYNLQMKTMSHYGENKNSENPDDIKLFYKISVLWNPDVMPRKEENKSINQAQEKSP